jgi:hypothetical protein
MSSKIEKNGHHGSSSLAREGLSLVQLNLGKHAIPDILFASG